MSHRLDSLIYLHSTEAHYLKVVFTPNIRKVVKVFKVRVQNFETCRITLFYII